MVRVSGWTGARPQTPLPLCSLLLRHLGSLRRLSHNLATRRLDLRLGARLPVILVVARLRRLELRLEPSLLSLYAGSSTHHAPRTTHRHKR